MKVVKVYGALRKRLGQCRFEFEVDTPAQAIKALCVNFPGLDRWLLDAEQSGMGFRTAIGKEKCSENDYSPFVLPWSEREVFSITPVIIGAGGVLSKIGIGIGLIALSIVLAPAAGGFLGLGAGLAHAAGGAVATGFISASISTVMGGIGLSLALGGIAQAISPQPKMSGLERGKEAARLESFSFSGIVNTTQQGLPVPVIYGRVFTGSAVLSSGLDVAQLK